MQAKSMPHGAFNISLKVVICDIIYRHILIKRIGNRRFADRDNFYELNQAIQRKLDSVEMCEHNRNRGIKLQRKEYSAGAVKLSFWFAEFRIIVTLLNDGNKLEDIKILAENDNIFSAATQARSKQIFNTVAMRVSGFPDNIYDTFLRSSVDSQKLITLISIINTDTLFFDFMNDVYREKLITGDIYLTDVDIRMFFHKKQAESEKVANWTDETINRLQKSYKAWLSDAGLLDHSIGDRKIIRPYVDSSIETWLISNGMKLIFETLTGKR
jgi:hypothetical protein